MAPGILGIRSGLHSKNMMIKEFQHFMEFQLSEVMKMNMKMQMIQFESIVNLIQRKLMKVNNKVRNMMI
jgi:hypothetical protein